MEFSLISVVVDLKLFTLKSQLCSVSLSSLLFNMAVGREAAMLTVLTGNKTTSPGYNHN